MTFEFDAATALTPTTEPGAFEGDLSSDWTIGPAVNGGLLMALGATALTRVLGDGETPHADPLALSAYFLSAAAPGPISVSTEVLRRGRSVSTGQVSLTQSDSVGIDVTDGSGARVERMRALATYGDLEASTQVHRSVPPPRMPAPEECLPAVQERAGAVEAPPLMHRLDLRIDPETAGWANGRPSGRGEIRAWIRLADDRPADAAALLFLLDAMPPVSFDLGIAGWAPTLEFSGHVRGRPEPGWLRMCVRSHTLAGGLMEEDAWIWDSTDRLVAQSRQLCSVRVPSSGLPG